VKVATLELAAADRQAMQSVAAGSIVLVVSHAPTVLPFASVLIRSLRGDEVLVETHLLSATRDWKRLVKAADLVIADALSAPAVVKSGPRRMREAKVIPPSALDRLRTVLAADGPSAAAPRPPAKARKAGRATG
jgi:hypothetical protein